MCYRKGRTGLFSLAKKNKQSDIEFLGAFAQLKGGL